MRPFEILLIVIVLSGLASILFFGGGAQVRVHAGMAASFVMVMAAVFLVHAVREGVHWQMGPAYLAVGILGVAVLLSLMRAGTATQWLAGAGVVCVLASVLLCWALPMFRFAPLSGPYPVGTTIVRMVDESRSDASPSGHRELMVQIWYPAGASHNPFAVYRRRQETTRVSSYQSVLRTRSRMDAPVTTASDVTGKFPVLLFNPAWNGRRTQDTFLTQELASHGFVVAAIDHTYNSEPVAFPDGRVVMAHHERAMEDVSTSTAEEVQRIGNTEVDRQALDDRFVLDELARWTAQQGSQWYGRLDTEHAGALGHSIGGAAAIETWATDPRILAAMNMDGWTFGTQASSALRKHFGDAEAVTCPLLFTYEENYDLSHEPANSRDESTVEREVDAWDTAHVRALLARYGGYWLNIRGADHQNFTDRAASSPLRRLAGGGPIDPKLHHRIVSDYAVQFFEQALRGKTSALLTSKASPYAEVSGHPVPQASVAPAASGGLKP